MIAEVLVDIPHRALDRAFDYEIPKKDAHRVVVGKRVEVPFGPRRVMGYVHAVKDETDVEGVKPLSAVLDAVPSLTDENFRLAETLAGIHLYPRAAYFRSMLPGALSMRRKRYLKKKEGVSLPDALAFFFDKQKEVPFEGAVRKEESLVATCLAEGLLEDRFELRQAEKAKTIDYIELVREATPRGKKQQAIIEVLKRHGKPIEKDRLLDKAACSPGPLASLLSKGIVRVISRERYREITHIYELVDKDVVLTPAQQKVRDHVRNALGEAEEFLLHGVIASGKTEIYLALAEEVLARGESAIVLLPEISLTPKVTAGFKARFGSEIAIYHSGLSVGEQYDEWRRMKRGEARIVVGARSAIFAPLSDIGLIVIDEEQSESYIQTENPPYDAREVARMRIKKHDAPLVLGSATPSVETYHRTTTGASQRLVLKERPLGGTPPKITLADMKAEFRKGNTSIFSENLREAIEKRLQAGEQTLLLINRRGHARFVLCRSCGYVIRCENCHISMTYHKHNDTLVCHHCDKKRPSPDRCPSCQSRHIRFMGLGTEKAEELVNEAFPKARTIRMDKDTTRRKDAHEKILHRFETRGDILVGTQMIAKGLDFDKVTLVGVLSADLGLHVPDFYAESETFYLLSQIAGRSGRRETRGEVVIQAYSLDHPVLAFVENASYEDFYEREIAYREKVRVPPFVHLSQMLFTHKDDRSAYRAALHAVKSLRKKTSAEILGPSRPRFAFIDGKKRYQLLLRHRFEGELLQALSTLSADLDEQGVTMSLDHYPRTF